MFWKVSPLKRGETCCRKGQWDQALDHLKEALAAGEDPPRAHYFTGLAWLEKGDLDQALLHFSEALKASSGSPILEEDPASVHLHLCRTANRQADYPLCQKWAEEGLRLWPSDGRLLNLLGHSHFSRSEYAQSAAAYRKAIAAEKIRLAYPDEPGVLHNNLALALEGQRKFKEALEEVEEALRIEPESAKYLNHKALILGNGLREVGKAVEVLKKAIALDPRCERTGGDGAYYYNAAGFLNRLGKHEAAAVFLEKALSFRPDEGSYRRLHDEIRRSAKTEVTDAQTVPRYTFADVGGMKPLKAEIRRAMDVLLVQREKAKTYKIEKNGLLFYGPPGCGKTFFAEALAGEFGLKFLRVSVASVLSKYIGDSSQNVEKLFHEAILLAPCLLFFDEFDAIAAQRGDVAYHMEDRRLVDALLQQVDRFRRTPGLVIAAATNDLAALDKAAIREGRFDYKIKIYKPDFEARLEILEVKLKGRPAAGDLDLPTLADRTEGFATSKLAALVNTAAVAAMEGDRPISGTHLKKALTDELARERYSGRRKGWEDLILDEASKEKLKFIELAIENPEAAKELGVSPPTGLLLHGPPGTGKTTVARVLACEVEASFYLITPADIFSKWLGESEKRVRDLFERARDNRPAILFLDEIDALLARRDEGAGAPWRNVIVNLFLMEMDGLASVPGVFVVGATNRPDLLDEALLRPGRLSELIELPLPGPAERARLIALFSKGMKLGSGVDPGALARKTSGLSGADLEDLCNHAGRNALLRTLGARAKAAQTGGAADGRAVLPADFEKALTDRRRARRAEEARPPIGFRKA